MSDVSDRGRVDAGRAGRAGRGPAVVDLLDFERAVCAWMRDELVFDLELVRVAGDDASPVLAPPMSRVDDLIAAFEIRWRDETGRALMRTERVLVLSYIVMAAGHRRWQPTLMAGGTVGRAEQMVSAVLRDRLAAGERGTPVVLDTNEGVATDAASRVAALAEQTESQIGFADGQPAGSGH
ncbi:MAG: hypothetical protein AAF235_07885 [Planctomycetota bacterium]